MVMFEEDFEGGGRWEKQQEYGEALQRSFW